MAEEHLHKCDSCGTQVVCSVDGCSELTCCGNLMNVAPVENRSGDPTDEMFYCDVCGREMICVDACGMPHCCNKEMLRKARPL